ncbi:MAG: hypothetical protein ACK4FJ_04555 [Ferrovibrio sp.]|uniref:hypothetical protein n=1 Tax=Ferrovibrio sp. TaxID=1917215 RepID=UPI0039188673
MDWLTLCIRLVEVTAWPFVAMLALLLLRGEIKSLMPLLRKIKAGPLEAEFEATLKEVSEQVDTRLESAPHITLPEQKKLYDLARVSPRSAILEAWRGVEVMAKSAAIHNGGSPAPNVPTALSALRELTNSSLISLEDAALFQDLRGLRNQAAHVEPFDLSESSAIEYINLAARLEEKLRKLACRE